MPNYSDQTKPPQRTFIHHVIKVALDEIYTLSDCLAAIQPSKYEVEKASIATLAFLIHQKTQDIKGLIDEMTREQRSLGLD